MADRNSSSVDTHDEDDCVAGVSSSHIKSRSVAVNPSGGHAGALGQGRPTHSPSLCNDNSDESPSWRGCHDATRGPLSVASTTDSYAKVPIRSWNQESSIQKSKSPFPAQGPSFSNPFQGGFLGNISPAPLGDLIRNRPMGVMDIHVGPLPSSFRLERTNCVAMASNGGHLPAKLLVDALNSTFDHVGIDILDFRHSHCVFECSYQQRNVFMSIFFRVFKHAVQASAPLYGSGKGCIDDSDDEEETGNGLIVEAQLREGDKLYFTALFREVMKVLKTQDGMTLAGSLRYKVRAPPAKGDELVLEEVRLHPPARKAVGLLAELNEPPTTAPTPTTGMGHLLAKGGVPPGGSVLSAGVALPLPAEMASEKSEELDSDTASDIKSLATMISARYVDVQANAATAVAGLTANDDLLRRLSHPSAAEASAPLCSSAARLLVETSHPPARRQAAVLVANLSKTPELRAALLASDPPPESDEPPPRRLLKALVDMAMGVPDRAKPAMRGVDAFVPKEEEIGTRRECMRALACFAADHRPSQGEPAIEFLQESTPTGRGATDRVLGERLQQCRYALSRTDSAAPSTCA